MLPKLDAPTGTPWHILVPTSPTKLYPLSLDIVALQSKLIPLQSNGFIVVVVVVVVVVGPAVVVVVVGPAVVVVVVGPAVVVVGAIVVVAG